jgi:hypothetical protein
MKGWVILLCCISLVSCGGSDSSTKETTLNDTTNKIAPIMTTDGLELYGEVDAIVGQSIGYAVRLADLSAIRQVQWRQTSGPEVNILAAHTQTIGFDVVSAGTYSFSIEATDTTGDDHSLSFSLTVTDSITDIVNIRLDHTATELGRVSLRVDSSVNKVMTDVNWLQLGGTDADDLELQGDSDDSALQSLFFTAPSVDSDEILQFQALVTFDDGTTAVDTALVLVKNATINTSAYFPSNDLYVTDDMIPVNSDSPYADALQSCVYNNQVSSSCTFATLPLIGQETTSPSIDDILDRTLVSHPWMGERFAEFLRQSSTATDILSLLRGVTAVVIAYDIRPSFYWTATGAIYLDANNLWRTPEERDTLNTAPDYRGDYGNDLTFGIYWRYVKDGSYYYPQVDLSEAARNQRDFANLEAAMSWLLYHELAHANDYFPPDQWQFIGYASSPLSYARSHEPRSDTLTATYPLASELLLDLAQVSFGGTTATDSQKSLTAEQGADAFANDIAPAYYSYYTPREDYATLFERFMMLYRLGVSADVGVISSIDNSNAAVTWGQRNRINETSLLQRTAFVVNNILPTLDTDEIQATLPSPELMPAGESWYNTLILNDESLISPLNIELSERKSTAIAMPQLQQDHFERRMQQSQ